jgi:hypothetical protein
VPGGCNLRYTAQLRLHRRVDPHSLTALAAAADTQAVGEAGAAGWRRLAQARPPRQRARSRSSAWSQSPARTTGATAMVRENTSSRQHGCRCLLLGAHTVTDSLPCAAPAVNSCPPCRPRQRAELQQPPELIRPLREHQRWRQVLLHDAGKEEGAGNGHSCCHWQMSFITMIGGLQGCVQRRRTRHGRPLTLLLLLLLASLVCTRPRWHRPRAATEQASDVLTLCGLLLRHPVDASGSCFGVIWLDPRSVCTCARQWHAPLN